jgi:hypothetical protein
MSQIQYIFYLEHGKNHKYAPGKEVEIYPLKKYLCEEKKMFEFNFQNLKLHNYYYM